MISRSFLVRLAFLAPITIAICAPSIPQAPRIDWTDDGDDSSWLTLPIIHGTNERHFGKRAVEVQLANRSDVAYYASLDIGNPPQRNFVQLDTGSFELWVNPDCDNLELRGDIRFCEAVGSYDPSLSSTSELLGETNTLRYGIGSAELEYLKDDIRLSGSSSTLRQVQFGAATSTEDEFSGILGIGYGANITTSYPNFIDQLHDQGITKRKAFSVGLGSKDEQEGSIIFGAIDTSKYSGSLVRLPIIPAEDSPDGVPRYWVSMNSINLTPPSGRSRSYQNTSTPVFLDTGATLTLLPRDVTDAIASDFGSEGLGDTGFYEVDCGLYDLEGTLDFEFDGITIRIPYREMLRVQRTEPPRCFLGIVPNDDFLLLGDTFLRSAYVVFDLQDDNIHMAQYENCGDTPQRLSSETDFSALQGECETTNPVSLADDIVDGDATAESTPTTTTDNTDTNTNSNSGSGRENSATTSIVLTDIPVTTGTGTSLSLSPVCILYLLAISGFIFL